jgi:hypothetical protein
MMTLVVYLFFQVVVSLSAFGRLIIHTGAMGSKSVLDPELERHLLPSGLHASLLIKATERLRRKTSVTTQYKTALERAEKQRRGFSNSSTLKRRSAGDSNISRGSGYDYGSNNETQRPSLLVRFEEEESILKIAQMFSGSDELISPRSGETKDDSQGNKIRRRSLSTESIESVDEMVKSFNVPRASVMNRVDSTDLKALLETTLSQCDRNSVTPAKGN